MRKYVFIALGGALGAVLRVAVKSVDLSRYTQNVPVNTLLINICGSFLLALILTISYDHLSWHPDIRLGITTGFIGAFTTFSTMSKEIFLLISSGKYFWAVLYAMLSIFLGFTAAWLGVRLAQRIDAPGIKSTKIPAEDAQKDEVRADETPNNKTPNNKTPNSRTAAGKAPAAKNGGTQQ